jgi:hypothetical protein
MDALPGVPVRNIFLVRVYRKTAGLIPSESPSVDCLFVERSDFPALLRRFENEYPSQMFGMTVQGGLAPYRPKKEPSFRQWLSSQANSVDKRLDPTP